MIDQTIPLDKLTAGMANCVREWILPHLTDPMARIQAEQLIGILTWLPHAVAPHALQLIQSDSQEARRLLQSAGEATPSIPAQPFLGDLLAENAALKESLEALAQRLRKARDPESAERLVLIQRYFVRSLQRESAGASVQPFAEMSVRDQEGKQGLAAGD